MSMDDKAMDLETKMRRAKEIDDNSRQIFPAEQKRLALLLSDVIETGLKSHELSSEDHILLTEQLEGMRLSIELDF